MKVLHIIIALEVGGAETMLARLIEAHLRSRTEVRHHVISLTSLGEIGTRLAATGIPVQALGMRSVLDIPKTMIRLVAVLRAQQPDIVQTWMYHADLLGGVAARMARIRRVIWGVRTTDIAQGGTRLTRWVRWLCARLSGYIPMRIVCAAHAAHRLHVKIGYDAARMVVIPNGLRFDRMIAEPGAVAKLRNDFGVPATAPIVGMVGRFNPVKGQRDFVRAAGAVATAHPECWFMMVGRDCVRSNSKLLAWIDETGVGEQFLLLGQREDIPVCLSAMDVFVLPSRTEGFPNVLTEAMAMARPCVSTDVGDASIVLDNCGIIVPAGNSTALAGGVTRLLEMTHDLRDVMREAGRRRVVSEYSLSRCADRFMALYVEVLAQ